MLSYRLGKVNDFLWEFKPVLSYSKPHTFWIFIGEEKEKCIYSLQPGHLEAEQNDSMVASGLKKSDKLDIFSRSGNFENWSVKNKNPKAGKIHFQGHNFSITIFDKYFVMIIFYIYKIKQTILYL